MPQIDFSRVRRLRPDDLQLDACGRPEKPVLTYVDLFKIYVYSVTLPSGVPTPVLLPDEKKYVDSFADFYLARVGLVPFTGLNQVLDVRLRWPNGRYSSQALGSTLPEVVYPPVRIPAGQWIGIELRNSGLGVAGFVMTFEGYHRVYIKESA